MEKTAQLIAKIRNGDNSAFEELCEQYIALLDSLSRKYSAMCSDDEGENDDFLQEAKMAFYKAASKYDLNQNKVTFGAFAKRCIANKLISCVRRANSKKRRKNKSVEYVNNESLQDTVIRHELGEKLISLAEASLSDYEMLIFKLYVSGKRAKEISARINRSEKSINNAIFRIRSKLKRQLISGT